MVAHGTDATDTRTVGAFNGQQEDNIRCEIRTTSLQHNQNILEKRMS